MSSPVSLKVMPSQKKSDAEKLADDKKWGRDCVDASEGLVLLQNNYMRASRYRKQVNYDLYNGKLHPSDIELIVNPNNIKNVSFPSQMKNHPITNPYIKCLVGDEISRRFDWNLKVSNDDAVSEKEKEKLEIANKELENILLEGLEQPNADPNTPEGQQILQQYQQETQKRLKQLSDKVNQNFQDKREIAGTHLLNHYQRVLDIKSKRTMGWEDALLVGEEIYCVGINNNEPDVRKCNPSNTYFLVAPDSHRVEDCDIIAEEYYVPMSRIIDDYYDQLKPEDIEYLESQTRYRGNGSYGNMLNYELQDPLFAIPLGALDAVEISSLNTGTTSYTAFDSQCNIRVVKTVWRSLRRIAILTYIDDNGQEQEKHVHEDYPVQKELGESIKYVWIGEWWEGTKIANRIYVNIQPRPIQFRSLNNISKCASGYVGSLYKTNASQIQSLFDMMKPYQYDYNIYYYRLQKLLINNVGKIATLDLARVPDGWSYDKWIYYAKEMNIAVTDSFKEAKKGAATGKLAGNMSGQQNVIDLSLGNEIQQLIELLEYCKSELDLITGINPARRGQLKTGDQGLGVTQESRQASSVITEWYFKIHDETGLRLMATLLETAKFCLRNGNKNIQYIADDMDSVIYNVDGELINEAEFGLSLVDSTMDAKARRSLEVATEIALQTGQVDLIQMMDINSGNNYSVIRRKIEKSIMDKQAREDQARQEENQIKQQQLADIKALEQQKLALEKYKADLHASTEIKKAEIATYFKAPETDANANGVPDIMEIAGQALAEREALSKQINEQRKQLLEESKHLSDTEIKYKEMDIKNKELELKKQELKSKEKIEAEKNKTALKVAKSNKNRYDSK